LRFVVVEYLDRFIVLIHIVYLDEYVGAALSPADYGSDDGRGAEPIHPWEWTL
jgi:hypothetical protein